MSCCGHTDWGRKSFYKEHVRAFTENVPFASCRETVSSRPDLPELLRGGRRTLVRKGRGLRTHVRVLPAQPDLLDARAVRAGMQLPSRVSDSPHQYSPFHRDLSVIKGQEMTAEHEETSGHF